MRSVWSAAATPDAFTLPHEVFQLGLKHGPLLVYLYLICCKSLKRGTEKMSCAIISNAVELCGKTVQTHLRTLADTYNGNLLYTVKPIEQILKEREEEFLAELKLAEAQRRWDRRCQQRDRPRSAL